MLAKMQFQGAVAVVTGGGTGIGRACAEALAELGATLVIAGLDEMPLRETRDILRGHGATCEYQVTDVRSERDVEALRGFVETRWGRAKALVNNAGNNLTTSITELATEKWRDLIAADLDSVFFMCRAFIPLLLKEKNPSILNVASSLAHIGSAKMPAYCAAKGGVVSLTRQLAVDYGERGLRVNAICPGPTLSPRLKGYLDSGQADRAALEQQVMLHRMAECEEIGDVAAFLVSDGASFVHGASIVIDGGQTIN